MSLLDPAITLSVSSLLGDAWWVMSYVVVLYSAATFTTIKRDSSALGTSSRTVRTVRVIALLLFIVSSISACFATIIVPLSLW